MIKDVQDHIHPENFTKFPFDQIKYRIQKLDIISYDMADDDAGSFGQLIYKEVNENGVHGVGDIDESGRFKRCVYLSKVMLLYAANLLDIIIIDTMEKHNSFNFPAVNIFSINSYENNIMLGFGVLNNETTSTYELVFNHAKNAWKKKKIRSISFQMIQMGFRKVHLNSS